MTLKQTTRSSSITGTIAHIEVAKLSPVLSQRPFIPIVPFSHTFVNSDSIIQSILVHSDGIISCLLLLNFTENNMGVCSAGWYAATHCSYIPVRECGGLKLIEKRTAWCHNMHHAWVVLFFCLAPFIMIFFMRAISVAVRFCIFQKCSALFSVLTHNI